MRTHGRPRCPGCKKHPQVCLCSGIEPRQLPCDVVILQHPAEIWRPSATAVMVTRLYPSALLVVRGDPTGEAELSAALARPGCTPYLVFPEPGAMEVGELARAGWPPGSRPLFVFLDGSWRQARRMRRRVPAIASLPVVRLDPPGPSTYRARRQSRSDHLSTAEAVALLLGRFNGSDEPDRPLQTLFDDWIHRLLVLRGLVSRRTVPAPSKGEDREAGGSG